MRQNGAFAYPPQMVRAACEFVLYSYATLLLPLLPKRNRELYAEVTKDLPAQPLSREFRRIEQRIPVDLSGLPKHYPVEKMKGFFRQLLVIVYEDQLRGVPEKEEEEQIASRNQEDEIEKEKYEFLKSQLLSLTGGDDE